ncbi:IS66 family transposase [Thalassolituus sp.]|jgi:transposase|uniref:IS66 family transposase n=1 Tax=Thalassolituus sp. TaxID=2030822 RepID=UPI0032D8D5B1
MKTPPADHLPDDIVALKQQLLAQSQLLQSQQNQLEKKEQLIHHHQVLLNKKQSRIQFLEEQIILFKQRQFGKSSEKSDQQAELFDEVEREDDASAPDTAELIEAESLASESSDDTPKPVKKTSGRKPLPAVLPRVRIEHDLAEADKRCACGCVKTCIGEDTSEQLDIIPAVVQVLVHARKKYACKACESGVHIAELPKQPLPKSNASPGLLAHIAVAKYQDGLPLYRMETIFKRMGIHLPRNTLANWMIKSSECLQPLYNLLNDQLLESGYIHMDETRVQVLKEPDKTAESLSYMWVRKTGDREHPIILFDYAGYHRIGQQQGIVALACMAHARRKFIDAQKVSPSLKGKVSKADMAITMIKGLYAIEASIKDQAAEQKYQTRQEKSQPQLNKLRAWLDKALQQTLPKGKTGEALAYLDKNWDKLTVYISDGRLNIDNNPVENAIRPFAIGRKNWLFSDSQRGAKASAMLYSIIETAKANELEPYAYLRTVLTRLPHCETVEDIEKLLPENIELAVI